MRISVDGGERRGGGAPSAEVDNDGLVDSIGDSRALGRHGGHDGRLPQRQFEDLRRLANLRRQ